MLIPAIAELPEILIGGTWEGEFILWEDRAETKRFSLTGWTVSLVFGEGISLTLTSGSGLTITAAEGKIVALISAATTAGYKERTVKYYLKIEKAGEVLYPVHGIVPVNNP